MQREVASVLVVCEWKPLNPALKNVPREACIIQDSFVVSVRNQLKPAHEKGLISLYD